MSDALAASPSTSKAKNENSERLGLWKGKWDDNQIGFHEKDIHPFLLKYGNLIIPDFENKEGTCSEPVRVFFPLCGKTVDMAFLAKHKSVSEVVGAEGIRKAIEEFSMEHPSLEVKAEEASSEKASFEYFRGKGISLLKGDYFELDDKAVGGRFDSVFDRASLVAINPLLRSDYVRVMKGLVKPGGTIMLVILERRSGTEEALKSGPPFSIDEAEIQRLFGGPDQEDWVESVTLLEEVDEFVKSPSRKERFLQNGVTSMFELVFEIKVKS